VWSRAVVVGPPTSEGDASLGQRRKQRFVQQFIPQPAVEALDEGVLHGLARRNAMPIDAGAISPSQDGVAGEFAAIVADYHLRLTSPKIQISSSVYRPAINKSVAYHNAR
jgi:hypothetical protein